MQDKQSEMKNVLKFIGGLLGGAFIGIALVAIIALLVDGDLSGFSFNSEKASRIGLSLTYCFISLAIAVVVNIMAHEAGHLVFGLMTGYKFLSYRVFNFALTKDEQGKLRWKKYDISGTLGQCLMEPPTDSVYEDIPYFWYNAGGVIANITIAIISLLMLKLFDLTMFWDCFFFMMLFVSFALALVNGLPLKSAGLNTDGSNILIMKQDPEKRGDLKRQLLIVAESSKGERPIEMPEAWFPNPEIIHYTDLFAISTKYNYICWLEDKLQFEEALKEIESIMAHENEIAQFIKMELGCDRLMLELATENRAEVIDSLNNKQLWSYLKSASKYSATKRATLYAWQLIHENNPSEAEKVLNEMRKNQDNYAFKGEARTAIALMEHIKDLHNGTGTNIESAQ